MSVSASWAVHIIIIMIHNSELMSSQMQIRIWWGFVEVHFSTEPKQVKAVTDDLWWQM